MTDTTLSILLVNAETVTHIFQSLPEITPKLSPSHVLVCLSTRTKNFNRWGSKFYDLMKFYLCDAWLDGKIGREENNFLRGENLV